MKYALLALMACDQRLYDQLYTSIILDTIHSDLTAKDITRKNDTIENLRALCRGQKSTFETGTRKGGGS